MNFDPVMSGMCLQGNSEIKENGLGRKLKICSPRGKHARISSSSSEQGNGGVDDTTTNNLERSLLVGFVVRSA